MAIASISRGVELTPYRPLDLTPWRRSAHSAAQRALSGQTVETVTMTRVEVTRARSFDGRGFQADWTFDERPLPSTEVVSPQGGARVERKEVEPGDSPRRDEASGFDHAAMTPLHTEGFLSLWERRHRGDHTGPPPKRAAAAFLAHERAPIG